MEGSSSRGVGDVSMPSDEPSRFFVPHSVVLLGLSLIQVLTVLYSQFVSMWWSRRATCKLVPRAIYGGVATLASAVVVRKEEDLSIHEPGKLSNVKRWRVMGPVQHPADGVTISRRIITEYDHTDLKLRLYQYEACPFCCKVRAFLNYYGFSYDVIEVSPLTRKEIRKLDDVTKLPTVFAQVDRKLSDSSLIISILASYLVQEDRCLDEIIELYPEQRTIVKETGKQMVMHPNMYEVMTTVSGWSSKKEQEDARKEQKWRKWVDEHFIHLIVPNVYRSWKECIQMFRWFGEAGQWDKVVPVWERYTTIYLGSIAMYFLSKKLRKKYDGADVRQLLVDACNLWVDAIENSPFLGGQQPNLADLALYGAMNSFVGSETFHEICQKTEIRSWFERMREAVDSKAGAALLDKRSQKRS